MNLLIIQKENKLEEITTFFTKSYPYLKLEFFKESHEEEEGNKMDQAYDKNSSIESSGGIGGEINFAEDKTVTELENEIKEKLNLNAQVFRKSGKVWLETTTTDSWTLREQNDRGEEAFS